LASGKASEMKLTNIPKMSARISAFSASRKPAPVPGPTQYDLTYSRTIDMFFHMKTTLNIDDTVMAQLKREAARQNRTMSELVETALRGLFRSQRKREHLPPLPTFQSGGSVVDVADRDALYQAMEGR
jgi:hypothetical protein